jgi:MFS family permease
MSTIEHSSTELRAGALQLAGIMAFPAISAAGLTMPLVAMPPFLHQRLGCEGFTIGLVLSAYAVSTLFSRPAGGRIADRSGVKRGVALGLGICAISGLLTGLAPPAAQLPPLSIFLLLIARLALGVGLALTNTAAMSWLFSAAGPDRAARAVGYNGAVGYSAMAFSPSLGQWLSDSFGLWSIGIALMLASLAGLVVLSRLKAPQIPRGVPMSFLSTFRRIALLGLALGLGSVAMAVISTYSSLVFVQKGWAHAAWTVSAFGIAYIGLRLASGDAVKRFGGQRVTLFCFAMQSIGFAGLWLAPSPIAAILAAAVTGLGMSLLYPALAVEVVTRVPAASRSSALGAFAMCLDVAVGVAAPLCGAVASLMHDFSSAYWCAGLMAFAGVFISTRLHGHPEIAASNA